MGTVNLPKQPVVPKLFRLFPSSQTSAALHANSGSNAFTGLSNPNIPYSFFVNFGAGWDGGNITIVGTNQYDAATTEIIPSTPNTQVSGVKIFKTISSVTKGAVGASGTATATVQTGDKLGIIDKIADVFGYTVMNDDGDGADPRTIATQYFEGTSMVDIVYNSINVNGFIDGIAVFACVINVYTH